MLIRTPSQEDLFFLFMPNDCDTVFKIKMMPINDNDERDENVRQPQFQKIGTFSAIISYELSL